jgi:hypothetical protein
MIRKRLLLVLVPVVATFVIWPTPAVTATIPEANPEKGLIVFYRPRKMTAAAIPVHVNHADGPMGTLHNGVVLHRYFQPGQHQFWAQVISQDAIMINVEAGKIYFVRGEATMGLVLGRPKFTQVDEATGRAAVAGL